MRRISTLLFLILSCFAFNGCPQTMVEQIEKLLPPPGYKPRYMSSAIPYDSLRKRYEESVAKGQVDSSRMYDQNLVDQTRMIDSVMRMVQSGQTPSLPTGMSMDSILSLRAALLKRFPQLAKRQAKTGSPPTSDSLSLAASLAPILLQLRSLDDKQFPERIELKCTLSDSSGRVILGLAPPYLKDSSSLRKIWTRLVDSCSGFNSDIHDFSVREVRGISDEPYALAFLIDHSGSMGKMRIRKLREAVRSTMNILNRGDMVSVLPFAGSSGVDVALTGDSAVYKAMDIEKHASISGGTSIYDGVIRSVQELSKAPSKHKKAILLFTDGEDNSSKATLLKAVQCARDSGVAVYAIAYGITNEAPLESLARLSGGRFYRIYSTREFPYMFSDIYRSLKNYYLISYRPPPCYGIHDLKFEVSLPELGVLLLSANARYDKSRFSELDTVGSISFINLEFETGKALVSKNAVASLEQIANDLKAHPSVVVEIRGHTDNVGSMVANQELSEQRAAAVAEILVKLGVSAKRIKTKGFGPTRPMVPNDNPENRAKNRRTEFVIIAK